MENAEDINTDLVNPNIQAGNFSQTGSSSSSSLNDPVCRICQIKRVDEPLLINPCNCKGSLGLMHRTCIEKWLNHRNSDRCEICKCRFAVVRKSKTFLDFLRQSGPGADHRNLLADVVCFLALTPLASISAWLCINGALHYLHHDESGSWEAGGLLLLASVLVLVFSCWTYISASYHWNVWREWRQNNFHIVFPNTKESSFSELLSASSVLNKKSKETCSHSRTDIRETPAEANSTDYVTCMMCN